MTRADIAVIGGSGFYSFLEDAEQHTVATPYGDPSGPISVGTVAGRSVAFLPRHGAHHEYPPHRINYRANAWALRSLGVRQVLAPCAVGSLTPDLAPGGVVVPDQLVDRTLSRTQSFVETGACHVPFADPYCGRDLRGGRLGRAGPHAGRHHGRGRGPALLHPRRVAALRRPGLVADQHDRPPRGGAGPRDDPVLHRDRARHRPRRRARGRQRGRPGGGLPRCSPPTSTGCVACWPARSRPSPTPTAAPAPPGRTASSSPTRSREGPADRLGRLHRLGHRRAARRPRRRPGPGRPDAPAGPWRRRGPGRHPPARRPRRRHLAPPARRRRRGVPPVGPGRGGGQGRRPARLRLPQRLRHGRAARRDARVGCLAAGARLLDGRLRRGPLRLPRARHPHPAGPRSGASGRR